MNKPFDLFISYRHSGSGIFDPDAVPDLKKALEEQGFKVFLDQTEISEFSKITKRVEESLANSKALLVYLSHDYFASRACQIEFTAAFIASFKNGGRPEDRIFIINPSGKTDFLRKLPVELNDAKFAMTPEQALSVLPEKLKNLNGSFKDLGLVARPHVYGAPALTGYTRFSGRIEDMWKIHSGLNASECSMVTGYVSSDIVILRGLGGIGKSLLAEEYAIRFSSAYPGGIYWLKAYGSYNPEKPDIEGFKTACKNEFIKIAQTSGINPAPDSSIEQLRYLIHQNIEKTAQKCLWIVDDIPQGLSNNVDEIKKWFGPHSFSKTLITTRSREYANLGKERMLDVLDKDSALEILLKHGVDIEKEKQDAEKLVGTILGFHALAVDISGAAISNGNMSVSEYITEIQKDSGDILLDMPDELVNALPNDYETSIVKTISRSIGKLPEKSGGLDFLRLAAVVSPATISSNLVKQVFEITSEVEAGADKRQAILAAPACLKYSLATKDGTGWTVHALISATVRFEGLADDDRGKTIKSAAIQVLTELIKHDLNHIETMDLLPDIEHARFLTKTINGSDELELLKNVAFFDHYRGNVSLAIDDWARINSYNKQILGPDHPDTLTSMNNLALTLMGMGDHTGAKELHEHVLERSKQILGPDHPNTLSSMSNLASTLKAMGDHAGAKELHEHVLERRKQILGPGHPDTLTSMNNLAFTLKAMGDYTGAKELEEQVLERRKQILGPDHPDTLTSMNNLAGTLRAMGDHTGAKELEEHVLERSKQILGPDHPSTLTAMNNLALTLNIIGNHTGAKELEDHVLERRKQILGPDHPDTLTSMNNLASTLWIMGDNTGAKELYVYVLERRKQILGPDHPDTLTSMNNLAQTLQAMGDHTGAKELQEHVLERSKQILGPDHPSTLTAMNNLALTLNIIGNHTGAKELEEHVLERRKQILGPDHPDTLTSMNNLASTLWDMGDHTGAKELEEHALERRKQILGIYHPDTTLSAWNFLGPLFETGEAEKALEIVKDNLLWLLDDSIELRDSGQIQIRQMLAEMFQKN